MHKSSYKIRNQKRKCKTKVLAKAKHKHKHPFTAKPGIIYYGDGGGRVCIECMTPIANKTGRNIDGTKVRAFTENDAIAWVETAHCPFKCYCGNVVIQLSDRALQGIAIRLANKSKENLKAAKNIIVKDRQARRKKQKDHYKFLKKQGLLD